MTSCVGAGCERVDTPANTGFVNAATQLNLVMEMGGEEFDRENMRIFSGEWAFCTIRLLGWQNCCTNSGIFVESGLLGCEAHEIELAEARSQGLTHYWGEYCARRILGFCRRRDRAWCVFTSQLGRIFHEQARPQLGIGWDHCDGFTAAQIQRIDFDRVDLSEYTATLLDTNRAARHRPAGRESPPAGPCGSASATSTSATTEPTALRRTHAWSCNGTEFHFATESGIAARSGRVRAGIAYLALAALLFPGLPVAGREWKDWCGDPGAASSARLALLLRPGRCSPRRRATRMHRTRMPRYRPHGKQARSRRSSA